MHLDVGTFPVREAAFGSRNRWRDGALELDREELLALVTQDSHLSEVDLDITGPGDPARIINYTDVVEPKVKVEGRAWPIRASAGGRFRPWERGALIG